MKTFDDIALSVEKLKKRYITAFSAYICRNKKYNANGIIVKFNRTDWILIKSDGTWEHIENKGDKTIEELKNL